MKVEFVFDNKGNKFDVAEIQEYLQKRLNPITMLTGGTKGARFFATVESVTQMSKWLVILIDFPTLKTHGRTWKDRTEDWWEIIAGFVVEKYDVVFKNFEVHGEGTSLLFKTDWRAKH